MTNLFFLILIFGFLFWGLLSIVIWTIKNGISPMPTTRKVSRVLLNQCPTDFKGKVYELGSGWGTLAAALAKHLPSSDITAIESSPIPFWVSKILTAGIPNLSVQRQDFYSVSLKDAALVVCYLYPGAMKKLKEKLEEELQPGAWVISHTFAIPGCSPLKKVKVNDLYQTTVYLYRVPLKNN